MAGIVPDSIQPVVSKLTLPSVLHAMARRAESVLGAIFYKSISIARLKLAIQSSLLLPTIMANALILGKDVDNPDAQSSKD